MRSFRTAVLLAVAASALSLTATISPAAAQVATGATWSAPWPGPATTTSQQSCSSADPPTSHCEGNATAELSGRLSVSSAAWSDPDAATTSSLWRRDTSTVHLSFQTPSVRAFHIALAAIVQAAEATSSVVGGWGASGAVLVVTGTAPCSTGRCSIGTATTTIADSTTTPAPPSLSIDVTTADGESLLPAGNVELDVALVSTAAITPSKGFLGYPCIPFLNGCLIPQGPITVTDPYYFGSAAASATVTIDHADVTYDLRPVYPRSLTAEPSGVGGSLVTWKAAASPLPLTGYRVERWRACDGIGGCRLDKTFNLSASTARLKDTGLTPGITYQYLVTPINSAGEGWTRWSAPIFPNAYA